MARENSAQAIPVGFYWDQVWNV